MLRNQNKLSEMLPAHHDFIYTFFSSAILGDRCMKLKFCNPDNFHPYKCWRSNAYIDSLSSYNYKKKLASRMKINAKIRMCEKYDPKTCHDYQFHLPTKSGKKDLLNATLVNIAISNYGLESPLLKGLNARKENL